MKAIVRLVIGFLFLIGLPLVSGHYPTRPAQGRAQHLQGAAARAFAADSGILQQIAEDIAPPQGRFFLEPAALTASDAARFDWLGFAVAVDGDTILVGADGADVRGKEDQGAAYIFTRDDGGWTQGQKLVAADGKAGDRFGFAVSLDGDTAVIGAPEADSGGNYNSGAAYVFERSGTTWNQQQKLVRAGGQESDNFGCAAALDGYTAVVSACRATIGGNDSQGAAVVFTRNGTAWREQQMLTASDGATWDNFGVSAALDGDTALIGADSAEIDGRAGQGAAYIFRRAGTTWTQQQKLVAADGEADNFFGVSVALDGQTGIVGAYGADVSGSEWQGAAYVYAFDGTQWDEQQKLTAEDGSAEDRFGVAVAVQGDAALAGAMWATIDGSDRGAAYLFTREGSSWAQQQRISPEYGAEYDDFGQAVALDGDTVAAGAWAAEVGEEAAAGKLYVTERGQVPWPPAGSHAAHDGQAEDFFGAAAALDGDTAFVGAEYADAAGEEGSGAVYVFNHNAPIWVRWQKLSAADGRSGASFGVSVAIDGDMAIVGANGAGSDWQGAAYIFRRSGTDWLEEQKLTASDGVIGDNFGGAVDIDGDTAVIGAVTAKIGANQDQGAVYVFKRSAGSWHQQQKLVASDGAADDSFGRAVAVSNDTIVAGADTAEVGDNVYQGKAYVFTRSGTTWSEQKKLVAPDGTAYGYFGYALALDGNSALIGSWGHDIGGQIRQGAGYVFTRGDGSWNLQQKLTARDGTANDWLGKSVALERDTAVLGAPGEVVGGLWQGAAYVFTRSRATWSQQQKLIDSGAHTYDDFGSAVGLDGESTVVSAPFADVNGKSAQGQVIFFERQKLQQLIVFAAPTAGTVGEIIDLKATASSGLPVFFSSNSPEICRLDGNSAVLTAIGECSISASQPGNASYSAADDVTNSFPVRQATYYLPLVR